MKARIALVACLVPAVMFVCQISFAQSTPMPLRTRTVTIAPRSAETNQPYSMVQNCLAAKPSVEGQLTVTFDITNQASDAKTEIQYFVPQIAPTFGQAVSNRYTSVHLHTGFDNDDDFAIKLHYITPRNEDMSCPEKALLLMQLVGSGKDVEREPLMSRSIDENHNSMEAFCKFETTITKSDLKDVNRKDMAIAICTDDPNNPYSQRASFGFPSNDPYGHSWGNRAFYVESVDGYNFNNSLKIVP
jgi:hypothetical protein